MSPAAKLPTPSPSHRRIALASVCIVVSAALLIGVVPRLRARHAAIAAVAENSLVRVRITGPSALPAQTTLSLPATLEPWAVAQIRARSSGYVDRWYVDIGTAVHAGQLLALLVAPELQAQLRQAREEEASAKASRDIAAVSARRWQDMLEHQATSAQEAEQRHSDLEVRQAQWAAATANVERLRQSITYTRIVAPFDGVITARAVDVGTLVDAGAATALFIEAQSTRLRCVLSVPEGQAAAVKPDRPVKIEVGDQVIDATIARTSTSIDIASRMQRVEVDLQNPEGRLLPGQYARVVVTTDAHPDGSVIPVEAVLFRPDGPQIAVVDANHRVSLRPVHVAKDLGTQVIVQPALPADTQLVSNPGDSISAGQRVQIAAAAAAGSPPGRGS